MRMIWGRGVALVLVTLFWGGTASAQIIEGRTEGGKTFTCMHTGLSSGEDCGGKVYAYSYVFIGSISGIRETGEEKELQIVPQEIFYGQPSTPLTILTSQGLCLPNMAIGDSWLFFLRREKDQPIVLDYYGNDSLPVTEAGQQIETLRRMRSIGDQSLLQGQVLKGKWPDLTAVPDAHVIAHRESDGRLFFCNSNAEGRYEFQPLPAGKYKITVDPIGSFRPDDAAIYLESGVCLNITLSKSPSAQLGGSVHHPDGSLLANIRVVMISVDESWFTTFEADEKGHFSFDGLEPGEYLLEVNLPGTPVWELTSGGGVPPSGLYYGGTTDRAGAVPIKLADGEKRDNLDFIVP